MEENGKLKNYQGRRLKEVFLESVFVFVDTPPKIEPDSLTLSYAFTSVTSSPLNFPKSNNTTLETELAKYMLEEDRKKTRPIPIPKQTLYIDRNPYASG
jgi:hypothetical protein